MQWEVPPSRRAAFVAVLVVLAVSVAVTAAGHFRTGGYLLAAAMAFAAVCRAVLPEKFCLGLLVRGRLFDVVTATVFAVAIALTTTILPG